MSEEGNISKEIGERIREVRKSKNMNQNELAEIISISTPHMSDIENGKTNLSVDILRKITEALEISADWVIRSDVPTVHSIQSQEIEELLADCTSNERNALIRLFDRSSIDERDKESVLRYFPVNEDQIAAFIAKALIFAIKSPVTDTNASPTVAERIIMPVVSSCKHFSGRKNELEALHKMLQTHDKIFIYGIGGIGKSEFVKQYISDHKKEYTNILYMTYSGSLKSTIASLDFL